LTVNGQTRVSGEQKPNTFALQVKEFADSIRQGREPLSSGRLVAPVNAILDIAFESARTNQALDLPARYPELGI
jgi:predicted dehydrogenase